MDASLASATPDVLATHARFVRALARELLADPHAADDVAQEAWLRFVRRPPREAGSVRAWLRKVTTRLSIERLRTGSRGAAREELVARDEALPSVTEELAQAEVLRSVAESVLALDEPYRTTVLLAYWRGWDARRIADETATPLATVRSRLQRAHARLRERLDRSHGRETWAVALAKLPQAGGAALGAPAIALVTAAGLALVVGTLVLRSPGADGDAREPGASVSVAGDISVVAQDGADGADGSDEPAAAREAVSPAAAPRLRVAGTVRELGDAELGLPARPAAGLELVVRAGRRGSGGSLAEERVRTDAEGRFEAELALEPAEGLRVAVLAAHDEHYRRLSASLELAGDPLAASALALERVPHGTLRGEVRDERGTPVAGVAFSVAGREATTAADGTFAISHADDCWPVSFPAGALALLGAEEARPVPTGGYTPLVLHVGPAAELELRVVDRAGGGVEVARVTAGLAPSELAVLDVGGAAPKSAWTDADGRAVLDGLWAGRKLVVTLEVPSERCETDAMRAGRLLLAGPRDGGRPIVIAAGERLVLEARVDVERDVAGEVVLPGGAPVAGAEVEVIDLGRGNAWSRPVLLALETDGAGRFAGRVRTTELVGPLRVVARAQASGAETLSKLTALGYGGGSVRTAAELRSIDVPAAELELAADDAEGLASLVLELGPRAPIAGTLLGRDGAPVRIGMGGSRIWAVPAGTAYHGHGVQARAVADAPGRFVVPGLPVAGRFDLVVSEELEGFYSFENFLHRFEGFAPGGPDAELRLPERRETRIVVRFAGEPPAQGIVLHRKLFPAADFRGPTAARVTRVTGASGWPEGTTLGFAGIGGATLAQGRTSDGYDGLALSGGVHALAPLEPGWYAVGVHAKDAFPQATPVLWFGEGEHVVELEPVPAATLRGRVIGDTAGEFLAVALADASGELVTLGTADGHGATARIVETSATGAFVLRHAPCGTFTLRAGTRAELERGIARRELPVEIVAGDAPVVELRL